VGFGVLGFILETLRVCIRHWPVLACDDVSVHTSEARTQKLSGFRLQVPFSGFRGLVLGIWFGVRVQGLGTGFRVYLGSHSCMSMPLSIPVVCWYLRV
jgi:hypothetical protein